MTTIEDRLKAALAATASTVREASLRPLVVPGRRPRPWPRAIAPLAAAAVVVVLVLGIEIAAGQLTGPPPAASKAVHVAPAVEIGKYPSGIAYDDANHTVYVAVTRYAPLHNRRAGLHAGRGGFRAERGILAMVDAATCNASSTRGCAHVSYAPAGGQGATNVAIDEQTHTVYVLNGWSKTVAVINAATCNASTTGGCSQKPALLTVPGHPLALAVNPRTDTIYVAGASPSQLSVINGKTCNATDTSGCGMAPATVSLATGPPWFFPGIAVDLVTDTVYVTTGNGLAVIDGRTCNGTDARGCARVLARAAVAGYPAAVAVDEAAGTVYVTGPGASGGGGVVTVINRNTCSAVDTAGCAGHPATIRGGPGPFGAAADQAAHTLYVTNEPGAVSMVNTVTCNATSVSTCSQFPSAFPVGSSPQAVTVDPAAHTVYVLNAQAGSLSVINGKTCNATDARGCPTKPPPGTPGETPYTCDRTVAAYESGLPAGPLTRAAVRVAAGSVGGHTWSLWARKGVVDPYGIEQGGLVVNGRWYALCDSPLSAGPDANIELIDAGAHGIVYGFIQHPRPVTIRLAAPGKLPPPSSVLLHGTTFFISQLPKPACSYHVMTLNAIASQGPPWSGTTELTFGTCAAGKLVAITRGSGSWGPGLGN